MSQKRRSIDHTPGHRGPVRRLQVTNKRLVGLAVDLAMQPADKRKRQCHLSFSSSSDRHRQFELDVPHFGAFDDSQLDLHELAYRNSVFRHHGPQFDRRFFLL